MSDSNIVSHEYCKQRKLENVGVTIHIRRRTRLVERDAYSHTFILIRGLGTASHPCHCKQQESNKDKIWSVIQNIRSRGVFTLETEVLMRDVASP